MHKIPGTQGVKPELIPGTPGIVPQQSNRTHRSSGYGSVAELTEVWVLWQGRTELTEGPGRYKNAVLVPRVFVALAYRTYRSSGYPYGYESRTELTQVPGTGMNQGCG